VVCEVLHELLIGRDRSGISLALACVLASPLLDVCKRASRETERSWHKIGKPQITMCRKSMGTFRSLAHPQAHFGTFAHTMQSWPGKINPHNAQHTQQGYETHEMPGPAKNTRSRR
jgi:hypothetical protein